MKNIIHWLNVIFPRLVWGCILGLIISAYFYPFVALADQPLQEKPSQERVMWDKRPVDLALVIGQERMVHFPTDVRCWVPEAIRDKVSLMSANGVVYITALRPFERTRIRIQSLQSQRMYLLDAHAADAGTHADTLIVTDSDYITNAAKLDESESKSGAGDWFVRLTRFAAQSLYAPERLHPTDKDITPIRVTLRSALPLVRGGFIEATPIRSWRGGGFSVTAVRIQNLTDEPIDIVHEATPAEWAMNRLLDLETDIRGHWLAITAQHRDLAPRSEAGAVSTLYLISDRPFSESREGI